eukprot:PhM_4_TR13698/c0_g1_i1/m.22932
MDPFDIQDDANPFSGSNSHQNQFSAAGQQQQQQQNHCSPATTQSSHGSTHTPPQQNNFDPFANPFHEQAPQQPHTATTTSSSHNASSGALDSDPVVIFPTSAAPPATGLAQTNEVTFFDGPTPMPGSGGNTMPPPPAQSPSSAQQTPRSPQPSGASCCSFEYYQQYFDVDTETIVNRLKSVFLLQRPPDYLVGKGWHYTQHFVAGHEEEESAAMNAFGGANRPADLYGPFWIATTLWISLAVVSNLLDRIGFESRKKVENEEWAYDFTKAVVAASLIYAYVAFLPMLFWFVAKMKNIVVSPLDVVCVYGYSFLYLILGTVICAVPSVVLQMVVCLVATCGSAAYILLNIWAVLRNGFDRPWFVAVVATVALTHIALATTLKFYFFA